MNIKGIVFVLMVILGSSRLCELPQKQFHMSYNAFSKRDHLSDMFDQINKQVQIYDIIYQDPSSRKNYNITELKPQLYYNQHAQKEEYIDQYQARVTMGKLQMSYYFNYEIDEQMGLGHGSVIADSTYFNKKIIQNNGSLEWDPVTITNLAFSSLLSVSYTDPKITSEEVSIIQKLFNDLVGTRGFKEKVILQFNVLYSQYLKKYLNSQLIVSTTSFKYSYRDLNLDISNVARQFSLSSNNSEGLSSSFQFGIQSDDNHCGKLPDSFMSDWGGLQEIFTLPVIESIALSGINAGLFQVELNEKWQVPTFQFYMGDLANSVSYANDFPAGDKFIISCSFNKNMMDDFKLSYFEIHELIATVPVICLLKYQDKNIINITSDLTINLYLVAQEKQMKAIVKNALPYHPIYTSIDSKFKVDSQNIADLAFSQVLHGLIGQQVFGSGWPLIPRRFPSTLVTNDYIVVFDSSEL